MNFNKVLEYLLDRCDVSKLNKARKIVSNDEVEIISISGASSKILEINSEVGSQNSDKVYDVSILINKSTGKIEQTYCDCRDFGNHYSYTYICKHCAATILKIEKDLLIMEKEEREKAKENLEENIIERLESLSSPKKKLNLEVYINHRYNRNINIEVSFKIGLDKLYVVKSISELILAKIHKDNVYYGMNFTYNSSEQEFNEVDEEIIEFISNIYLSNYNNGYSSITSGKYIYLPTSSLRSFLKLFKNKGVYINDIYYPLVKEDMPLQVSITDNEECYNIDLKEKIEPLTVDNNVFLCNNNIYVPSKNQVNILMAFFDYFINRHKLNFKKEKSQKLFNYVLPKLELMSKEVKLDKKINNVIKEEGKGSFYIDEIKKNLSIEIKVSYGESEINIFDEIEDKDKIIIRDIKKEEELRKIVEELNFIQDNKRFIFTGNEEEEYYFLTEGCKKLSEFGEVFYSQKLKSRKVYKSPSIRAVVSEGKDGYLDFSFNIEDIDIKEYKEILKAFKNNKKFIKLKDNSIVNLENKEIKDLLKVVDKLSDNEHSDNRLRLSKGKAIVLDNYLSEGNFNYVEGSNILKEISEKLKNIGKLDLEVPKELNATLREYQVIGFKWFKNISYLGFGGILADEMGLGKTVQTIAFLLSEVGKKSIIVAPTSLIYNWKNEFEKFAPTMNVKVVHGNKVERKDIIENSHEYDVILTTYGTLRNDIEFYVDKNFDYCILDEGQNIKNPLSKISTNVKKVNAKTKFVLSGTPIENNLLELWSIFDFIMPGYLYSSSIFKKRYIDADNNRDDLIKHVSPFILRREKKDVILELPEKIEKKYYVEMTKEQKKVYKVFSEDIKNKLNEDSFENDKITIFSYLTKLRQICLDPSLVIEDYKGKSAKIEEVLHIIRENINNNSKILLFSQFTSVLKNISPILDKEKVNYMYLDGSISAKKRLEMVDEFNNNNDCNLFLISLKAGGTGLNLTSANVVIHFDPWWNPAIEDQATDRAHRIGQKNVVNVIKMISEGTIEEKIIKMQEEKKVLIGDVINNKSNSENSLMKLSTEELKELFS